MLKLANVLLRYDNEIIVEDLSAEFDNGLTIILGQNGSGKTTIFRGILGSINQISGKISLDGKNLLKLSAREKAKYISVVRSVHNDISGITGKDYVLMAFYPQNSLFYNPDKKEIEIVLKIAKDLSAEHLLNKTLDKMSSGERQLIELLSALCQNTKVMLLDEPTSSLDYNRTHEFLERIKEISKDKIIVATLHDPNLAIKYADRILLLDSGTIVDDFNPKEETKEKIEERLRVIFPKFSV